MHLESREVYQGMHSESREVYSFDIYMHYLGTYKQ